MWRLSQAHQPAGEEISKGLERYRRLDFPTPPCRRLGGD
jgi:hypothetical protein